MIKPIAFLFCCISSTFVTCKSPVKPVTKTETAQTDSNSLQMDSVRIQQFFNQHAQQKTIDSKKVADFYRNRNYAYAWINRGGVNEYAGNFINLLRQEPNAAHNDSLSQQRQLVNLYQGIDHETYQFGSNDSLSIALELLLTSNFLAYAQRTWGDVNDGLLQKASWFIDRKRINPLKYLDTVLDNNNHPITTTEPTYRQYGLLKANLTKYYAIEKQGGWEMIPSTSNKALKKGDSAAAVIAVKKELALIGDMPTTNGTPLFDDALFSAVQTFQQRNGLPTDGVLTAATIKALQIPIKTRIEQILINMERSRWVPVSIAGDYLAVNIPEYKLHVYHSDTLMWSCSVVVGKSNLPHHSAIFNDKMEDIVFSPYWNVPKGILGKEVLPGIRRNSQYLANHNMEVVNYNGQPITSSINWNVAARNFPYLIREKPGITNSLGLVKFLFPNSYDIYLHDTPQKSLFNETKRAFSHGCIRIEEPVKLAKFLLRTSPKYTDAKIAALMNGGKETYVRLPTKVPVFIAYFTAFVDRDGKLNFRDDVYKLDAKLKQLLFVN